MQGAASHLNKAMIGVAQTAVDEPGAAAKRDMWGAANGCVKDPMCHGARGWFGAGVVASA